MTPFLIDLACAWSPAAGVAFGPWELLPPAGAMTFQGELVEPCGWRDLAVMAGDDADAGAQLEGFRADTERRLQHRAEFGSLFGPR
jgi:hypothetical protein